MSKIKNTFETIILIAILIIIIGILMAVWAGAWEVILLAFKKVPYLGYSIKMVAITFLIILMYEIGKKHLSEEIIKDWKSIVFFVGIVAFYILGIMTQEGPETGYSREFDFQFYLTILLPTVTAMLTGLYRSKKK